LQHNGSYIEQEQFHECIYLSNLNKHKKKAHNLLDEQEKKTKQKKQKRRAIIFFKNELCGNQKNDFFFCFLEGMGFCNFVPFVFYQLFSHA
jgi:hypothetical protein